MTQTGDAASWLLRPPPAVSTTVGSPLASCTHPAQPSYTTRLHPPASPPLGAPSHVSADPTILVRGPSLEVRASVQCMNCGQGQKVGKLVSGPLVMVLMAAFRSSASQPPVWGQKAGAVWGGAPHVGPAGRGRLGRRRQHRRIPERYTAAGIHMPGAVASRAAPTNRCPQAHLACVRRHVRPACSRGDCHYALRRRQVSSQLLLRRRQHAPHAAGAGRRFQVFGIGWQAWHGERRLRVRDGADDPNFAKLMALGHRGCLAQPRLPWRPLQDVAAASSAPTAAGAGTQSAPGCLRRWLPGCGSSGPPAPPPRASESGQSCAALPRRLHPARAWVLGRQSEGGRGLFWAAMHASSRGCSSTRLPSPAWYNLANTACSLAA